MVDLLSFVVSISSLAFVYFVSVIRRRLYEVDGGSVKSLLILNQPHHFKRYWTLASERHWSRVPIFGACVTFLCVLASSAWIIAILISRKS
jgi:hypothetical protein